MGKLTATHTYVILEISKAAYDEIAGKLRDAGYDHVFMDDGELTRTGSRSHWKNHRNRRMR